MEPCARGALAGHLPCGLVSQNKFVCRDSWAGASWRFPHLVLQVAEPNTQRGTTTVGGVLTGDILRLSSRPPHDTVAHLRAEVELQSVFLKI